MLHGSGCFTGHVSRFLEKSPVKHLAAGGNIKSTLVWRFVGDRDRTVSAITRCRHERH
jgi:hypothetical protein